ncbi:hypothetical protein IW140_005162, partial [Coemansia sp. RSA 1813]
MDTTTLVQILHSLTVSDSIRNTVDRIAHTNITEALLSKQPYFLNVEDIAIPVDITTTPDNEPVLRSLLLRPQIHIAGNVQEFISRERDPDLSDDDIIQVTSNFKPNANETRVWDNALYIAGCSGSGKSYMMREIAWRVRCASDNARVVYIPDCKEWANCNSSRERLVYFCKAVMIGLALDTSFNFNAFGINEERATPLTDLVDLIIDGIGNFCEDHGPEGRPLRILFCFDRYQATDDIQYIIKKLAERTDLFYVLLATKGNQPPPENTKYRIIGPWFSNQEAGVFLRGIWSNQNISISDTVTNIVSRYTDLNPREIRCLVKKTLSAKDLDEFTKLAAKFGSTRIGRNLNNRKSMHRPSSSGLTVDFTDNKTKETVFRMFNNLPASSSIIADSPVDRAPALQFHPYISMEPRFDSDDRESGILEFSCPRSANTMFKDKFNNEGSSFESMKTHFQGSYQGEYELIFATLKHAFKTRTLTMINNATCTDLQRIVGEVTSINSNICRHLGYDLQTGFDSMALFTSANPINRLNKTSGLDYLVRVLGSENCTDNIIIAVLESKPELDQAIDQAKQLRRNPTNVSTFRANNEPISRITRVVLGISSAIDITIEFSQRNGSRRSNIYLFVRPGHRLEA